MPPKADSSLMANLSVQQARQLLGDETYRLSDAEIQAKIDIMMVIANRIFDVLETKNTTQSEDERTDNKPQA